MHRVALLTVGALAVLGTTALAQTSTFYLHETPSPVPVPGGTTTFVLDENPPVATTPDTESRSVSKKTTALFPTFIAPAFAAPAVVGLDFDLVIHLSANLSMNNCAVIAASLARVDSGGAQTFLVNGNVQTSLPQGGGGGTTGFAPVTISFIPTCGGPLDDPTIAAGESIAVSISVFNACNANRTVFLASDATTAPGNVTLAPLAPPDPIFLRNCFAKCQLGNSKAGVKFAGAKAKCVMKCVAGARKGYNPYADCYAPYGGATATCILDPLKGSEAKAATSIIKSCTGPGRCPSCYEGGDCDAYAPDQVQNLEGQLDSFVPGVYCEETTDLGKAKCMDGNIKGLTRLLAARSKCYDKCFAGERKGVVVAGSCAPPATDPATATCLDVANAKAIAALDKVCYLAPAFTPACYDFISAATWVNLGSLWNDGNIPGIYCPSPSGAFVE